jgi:hypothetical protein
MSPIRYRERDSSSGALAVTVGALAGLAAGVLLAQRFGGLGGLTERVRERFVDETDEESRDAEFGGRGFEAEDFDDDDDTDVDEDTDEGEMLEERVLEAFRNDPILSERAIDIGAMGRGIIELTGWVHADEESTHAITVTRGVPGVETVVNRLVVREEEERLGEAGGRYVRGESEASPRWEGIGVGTGRPRQGTSADPARHADPKPILEDRWLSEEQALRAAADDTESLAERRAKTHEIEGDRTGGSPLSPSGVPKSDHVADPASAEPILREQTGRVDRNLRAD